jgi:hypothetical protein
LSDPILSISGPEALPLTYKVDNECSRTRVQPMRWNVSFPEFSGGVNPDQLQGVFHFQDQTSSTKYYTGWHVLSTWPNGNVRFAAAAILDFTIPGNTSRTLKLIKDEALSSPGAWEQHEDVVFNDATDYKLESLIKDRFGNSYVCPLDDTDPRDGWWEEQLVESNDIVRVYMKRSGHYHATGSGTNVLARDYFTMTYYRYVFSNSRFVWLEARLGNDYLGNDNAIPYDEEGADPNDYPLGPIGFDEWSIQWNNTTIDAYLDAQSGLYAQRSTSGTTTKFQMAGTAIPRFIGFAEGVLDYLPVGANIARGLMLYYNGGTPTSQEDTTWIATTLSPTLSPITAESVGNISNLNNLTINRSLSKFPIVPGTFEFYSTSGGFPDSVFNGTDDGNGNITGPGIAFGSIDYNSGFVSITINIGPPIPFSLATTMRFSYEFYDNHPLFIYPTLECANSTLAYGQSRCKYGSELWPAPPFQSRQGQLIGDLQRIWGRGSFGGISPGGSPGSGGWSGSRATMRWGEYAVQQTREPGTPRGGYSWLMNYILLTNNYLPTRVSYTLALQGLCRPGKILWGFKGTCRASEDPTVINILTGGNTGFQTTNGPTGGGNTGLRNFRVGFSRQTGEIRSGEPRRLYFSDNESANSGFTESLPFNLDGYTTETSAGVFQNGLRRVLIAGDDVPKTVIANSGNQDLPPFYVEFDSDYTGSPGVGKQYVLFNDPDTSFATTPANDLRDYGKWRLGTVSYKLLYGWDSEEAAHMSNHGQFEAWQVHASYTMLDGIKHHANAAMAFFKDTGTFDRLDQNRANAWTVQAVLQGIIAGGYVDPDLARRCTDFIKFRFSERFHSSANRFGSQGTYSEPGKPLIRNVIGSTPDSDWTRLNPTLYGDWIERVQTGTDPQGNPIYAYTRSTFSDKIGNTGFQMYEAWHGAYCICNWWGALLEFRDRLSSTDAEKLTDVVETTTDFIFNYLLIPATKTVHPRRATEYAFVAQYYPNTFTPRTRFYCYYHRSGYNGGPGNGLDRLNSVVPGTQPASPVWSKFLDEGSPTIPIPDPSSRYSANISNPLPTSDYEINWFRTHSPPSVLHTYNQTSSNGPTGITVWFMLGSLLAYKHHRDPVQRFNHAALLNEWLLDLANPIYNGNTNTGANIIADGNGTADSSYGRWISHLLGEADTIDNPFPVGDVTTWWNTSWLRRKAINSDSESDAYSTQDVYSVTLDSSIINGSLASGLADVRVILQRPDITFEEVPYRIMTNPENGQKKLYFRPVEDIPANTNIGTQAGYRYYIYYANPAPPQSNLVFENPGSLDGPVGPTSNTAFIWNQEGNLLNSISQFNINPNLTANPPGTLPVVTDDGPFGGSVDFRFNRSGSLVTVAQGRPALNPDGEFTFDFLVICTKCCISRRY